MKLDYKLDYEYGKNDLPLSSLKVALAMAAKLSTDGVVETEYEEYVNTEMHKDGPRKVTRKRLIVISADWADLPRALTYPDVAFEMAKQKWAEHGVTGVPDEMLAPYAKPIEDALRADNLLKNGARLLYKKAGLPYCPVTKYFFKYVIGMDPDVVALLNGDVLDFDDINGSLPGKPALIKGDDKGKSVDVSSGQTEGMVFFPKGTRASLYLEWRKRITQNGGAGFKKLIEESADGMAIDFDKRSLVGMDVEMEKLPKPGYSANKQPQYKAIR